MRRPLLTLAALALVSLPFGAQDAKEYLRQGADLLREGKTDEAADVFKKVLQMDLSNRQAFDLFTGAEADILLQMMTAGGQTEVIAKALMQKGREGARERSNDEAAIREKLTGITSNDYAERMQAIAAMSAEHGEFAVPYMIYFLGDQADEEKRVLVMSALTRMGDRVVPPLIAALESQDAYMRRNVALTLGYTGDKRAVPALSMHAHGDAEGPVRTAATDALARLGGGDNVSAQFVSLGNAYYHEDDSVLKPGSTSTVVWDWQGQGLVATEIPSFLYAPELAKRAYKSALAADPANGTAAAGMARCVATQQGRLDEFAALEGDAGDWGARIHADMVRARIAGAGAFDAALGMSLDEGDQVAASMLCRELAAFGTPTPNLQRALSASSSGAIRGEAAVALAGILGDAAGADTISALTEAAARNVLQIAAVIDGNDGRRRALTAELEASGMMVNEWSTGGRGLAGLRAVPGIDIVIVADQLPDLTLSQVANELKNDPRTASTPLYVLASSEGGDHGELIDGVLNGSGDAGVVEAALSEGLNRDREQANVLAARAASSLADLAAQGADVSVAAAPIARSLANRPDDVLQPMLRVLGLSGGSNEIAPVAGILADEGQSEAARVAAAKALGGIFARVGQVDQATLESIYGIANSADSNAIRAAAGAALGRLDLSPEMRAQLIAGAGSL